MLLKHSVLYLAARGLPGLVNFSAIAVYTRLLVPEEYGRFALVVAGVGLFNVVFFQWLRLALLRFLPAHLADPRPLLSTVLAGFSGVALLTGVLGMGIAWRCSDPVWRGLILLAVPLLWSQAWFELNLELTRSRLQPGRYGVMSGVKAITSLLLGALGALWGIGAFGPLFGLLAGFLFASSLWGKANWKGIALKTVPALRNRLLQYGLPFTATFVLEFILDASDRFFIARFWGEGSAGVYAASYDLVQNSLTLLMVIVNLAVYPLAVRALEIQGSSAAKQQLMKGWVLLFGFAFPATAGVMALAPHIAGIFLGESFQEKATYLIPVVAIGTFLRGVRVFHFDLAFQFSQRTIGQVWVMGGAALLNILLNLWWIPRFGLMGAAWATAASYAVALVLSIYLGQRIFATPVEWIDSGKVVLATGIMLFFLLVMQESNSLLALIIGTVGGASIYGISLILLNVGGARIKLFGLLKKLNKAKAK